MSLGLILVILLLVILLGGLGGLGGAPFYGTGYYGGGALFPEPYRDVAWGTVGEFLEWLFGGFAAWALLAAVGYWLLAGLRPSKPQGS